MIKKLKYIFILLTLLCIFLLITVKSYANTISQDLKNNFFRLHILANSDSKEDQILKLKVRDSILEYMNTLSYKEISKDTAIYLTSSHLEEFKNIAETTIRNEGYNYKVSLSIGNFYFPTKIYGNISLPAGYYDALKIEIGDAKGQNWWCSLFPPLCFVDVSSGIIDNESSETLEENLSDEEFAIITDNSETIKFKFKIVEMFGSKK